LLKGFGLSSLWHRYHIHASAGVGIRTTAQFSAAAIRIDKVREREGGCEVIGFVHFQAHADTDHAYVITGCWVESEQMEGEAVEIVITAPYTVRRTFFSPSQQARGFSERAIGVEGLQRHKRHRITVGNVTDPGAHKFATAIVRVSGISTGDQGSNHPDNE